MTSSGQTESASADTLNTNRLDSVFSARDFLAAGNSVTVIGAGSLGGHLGGMLADAALPFTIFDDDKVSEVNIGNQPYSLEDIGKPKVFALTDRLKAKTGVDIIPRRERFDGSQELGNIVMVAVHDMEQRRLVWNACKMKFACSLLIEGRITSDQGRVYAIDPCKPAQIRGYEAKDVLYTDDQTSDRNNTSCRTKTSVGATAQIFAGLMVWQLYRWFAVQNGSKDVLEQEIIQILSPMYLQARRFE